MNAVLFAIGAKRAVMDCQYFFSFLISIQADSSMRARFQRLHDILGLNTSLSITHCVTRHVPKCVITSQFPVYIWSWSRDVTVRKLSKLTEIVKIVVIALQFSSRRAQSVHFFCKMNRLFGRGKPKAPPPNLTDAIANVRLRSVRKSNSTCLLD